MLWFFSSFTWRDHRMIKLPSHQSFPITLF
jgi:hypothetical protein